jgi:hypothetical protein
MTLDDIEKLLETNALISNHIIINGDHRGLRLIPVDVFRQLLEEKARPFDCEEIEKALNALNEHTFKVSE